jgi:hypothetical protein
MKALLLLIYLADLGMIYNNDLIDLELTSLMKTFMLLLGNNYLYLCELSMKILSSSCSL